MPKLTYWIARCNDDSDAYSIRTRTKKACEAEYQFRMKDRRGNAYDRPIKVTVEYSNAFDLMEQCMNESRGCWEYNAD